MLKEIPAIESKIQDGSLSVTAVSKARSFFKKEEFDLTSKAEILESLENKSTREVEKTLLGLSDQPEVHLQEKIKPVTKDLSEVKFFAGDELLQNLEKLKGLLAHSHPNMTMSELIEYLAQMGLKKLDPAQQKSKSTPAPNESVRYVSRNLKREIFKRDESRCTYVNPKTGRRCASNYRLQLDHKIPWAREGKTSKDNLRLLCQTHNLYMAEQWFGERYMRAFTKK
jgi:hypothetical protein